MATSYANNSGTGERRPEIVVTSDIVSSAGDISAGASYTYEELLIFVDGVTSGSLGAGGTAREFGNGNNGLDRNLTFDFGVNASIVIDEFKIYISGATNFGTWTLEGSANGSSWTTIGASFTLQPSGGSQIVARTNSTGYRFYRLHTTSFAAGGGGSGNWTEIEFKIEDTTPQNTRCSWFNTGGKGNRSSLLTMSGALTYTVGVVANLVDGDLTNNSSHAATVGTGQTAGTIVFDFGASNTNVIIDTTFIWIATATSNTQGTWKLQGSANGSSWTDVGTAVNLLNQANLAFSKLTVTNSTGYRYYRLLQVTGTTTVPTILEIEFRASGIALAGGGTGSVIIIGTCG